MPRPKTFHKISDAAPAPFETLRRRRYGTILVDAPLRFAAYDGRTNVAARATEDRPEKIHYPTMSTPEIMALPVASSSCTRLRAAVLDITHISRNQPEDHCGLGIQIQSRCLLLGEDRHDGAVPQAGGGDGVLDEK